MKPAPLSGRRFLLVTLPPGPFGVTFARQLHRAGADTRRVLLNGGDLFHWGPFRAVWPRVPAPLWRAWVGWRLTELGITDIVVFGDTMTYSADALAAAREKGVRTWILENGYNRPDWITLEPSGVNNNSCMARDARSYDQVDVSQPTPDLPRLGAITPYHVVNIFMYFAGVILGGPLFPTYRYPYMVSIWPQMRGHIRRYLVGMLTRSARRRSVIEATGEGSSYFLACLQREGDSQLVEHSELKTNRAFMEMVVESFATHADPKDLLVFKNHPLDPGVEDLAGSCRAIARSYGVADRVYFLDEGVFATLARGSRGVIAVNSTAAYAALGFGTPVKLLGRAVFDVEGLVDRRPLESFWRRPMAPDSALFARFRRRLSTRTQVYGSFHNPRHLRETAERVVQRIIAFDAERWFQTHRAIGSPLRDRATPFESATESGAVAAPIYRTPTGKYDRSL